MHRFAIAVVMVAVLAVPLLALAQLDRPYVLLTWKAGTYVPPYYEGKALPVPNSKITVAADIIDGSRVLDLSDETVYWYLNDAYLTGGVGITRVVVTAPDTLGKNTMRLRVMFPNYQGGTIKNVTIPISLPEAVIESSLTRKEIKGEALELRGWPYFFNVRSLSGLMLSWRIAGKEPTTVTDPGTLRVVMDPNMPKGSKILVEFEAENPAHIFEATDVKDTFTVNR